MKELTQESLKSTLSYDPETGHFRWKRTWGRAKAGAIAGALGDRYVLIRLFGVLYKAHRLAFLYMTGEMPADEVDHIDMDRGNNRFCNLRKADKSINAQNKIHARSDSRTGVMGVGIVGSVYRAQIRVGKKQFHLGCFPDSESAYRAYLAAKRKMHAGCTI